MDESLWANRRFSRPRRRLKFSCNYGIVFCKIKTFVIERLLYTCTCHMSCACTCTCTGKEIAEIAGCGEIGTPGVSARRCTARPRTRGARHGDRVPAGLSTIPWGQTIAYKVGKFWQLNSIYRFRLFTRALLITVVSRPPAHLSLAAAIRATSTSEAPLPPPPLLLAASAAKPDATAQLPR